MNGFSGLIGGLLTLLANIAEIILAAIVAVELWLRSALRLLGAPPLVQTIVLIALGIVLILGSIRLFSGIIRIGVVLVLILIVMHIIMPVVSG